MNFKFRHIFLFILFIHSTQVFSSPFYTFFEKIFIKKQQLSEVHAISIIKIVGEITTDSTEQLIKKIMKAIENSEIKGVLLIIDSGGGQCGTSELLFREIKQLSTIKPVVALIINSACSGAYLAATAADWIIAQSTSNIGSIGAYTIIEKHKNPRVHFKEYTAEVEYEIMHSGKFKAITHPNSSIPLTKEARQLLQSHIDIQYKLFLATVAKERNLSIENSGHWAEGQKFSGWEALEKGLIDEIGGYSDAILKLKTLIQERGVNIDSLLVFIE